MLYQAEEKAMQETPEKDSINARLSVPHNNIIPVYSKIPYTGLYEFFTSKTQENASSIALTILRFGLG